MSLNDVGQIAFDKNGELFIGPDVVNDKVIGIGDSLDGSPVASVYIGRRSLNNLGQIAFNVFFSDGRPQAVYRADPVPVNFPPVLSAIGNKGVNESSLLSFTATASDPNIGDTLTFSLDAGAPSGASISSGGIFTWTPTEAQGPGNYLLTVRVTDSASPALSDTETISITVDEVNSAPVLAAIGNKTVKKDDVVTFVASATDSDLPANTLTFSLDAGAPTGATINLSTGVFTWTPSKSQNPGTYPITIRVSDNGSPSRSAFETITVTVNKKGGKPTP